MPAEIFTRHAKCYCTKAKFVADDNHFFYIIFQRKYLDILCESDDSHEMSILIFFEEVFQSISKCRLLQLWLELEG